MINMNKNTEVILQIQRDQKITKERHCLRNKTIITKFCIRSSRISLISNMLMVGERTYNVGETKNGATGSKTSANFTTSYCRMIIHH